ncbi:MAG TPA: hypothetical protein VFV28_07495 [Limnobacter sp.]|nr:hypothetical protein [Limnobacter sp.]
MKAAQTMAVGLMLQVCSGLAQSAATDSDLPVWLQERFEPVHYDLTRMVDNTARNLDQFFGTEESLFVENESFMRLGLTSRFQPGESKLDPSLRFKIDMPTTQERLRLIVESDIEEPLGRLSEQGIRPERGGQRFDTNNSAVGLEQRFDKNPAEGWVQGLGAGVKFGTPLDPYVRYSAVRQWNFSESRWQINSGNRVTQFNQRGLQLRTSLDINRPLSENTTLRFQTYAEHEERRGTAVFSQTAEINKVLDARTVLRYSLIVVGEDKGENTIKDYILQAFYRRDIHKNILFFDIVPEVHFPTEGNQDPYLALTFRLEAFFRGNFSRSR